MIRILIDQDSTVYDLSTPWYKLHNEEYGHIHEITEDKVYTWNTAQICKDNDCPADIYSYFNNSKVWSDGKAIQNSVEVTERFVNSQYELGFITTAANAMSIPYKVEWLQNNFPHIPNILITHKSHIKHWVQADFLVDDGIHNEKGFNGIFILYNTAWNQDTDMIRAKNWLEVERIIDRGVYYINTYKNNFGIIITDDYRYFEHKLKEEIKEGKL